MTAQLVRELETHAAALTARVVSEMYCDPFWSARFGERGRRFSEEDGRSHISHLVQASVAGDPEVLSRDGRWLRSVLTTRGMCTRHLTENFERLEWAVRDLNVDAQPDRGLGLLHKIFEPKLAERFLQQVLFPEGTRA